MNIFGSATEKKYTLVYKQKDKIWLRNTINL
jgi:hypothetical protein